MQLVNLLFKDLDYGEVYLQQFLCEPTDHAQEAITNTVRKFMQTEGAPYVLNEGAFTWGEVRSEIHDSFWQANGFTPVDRGITVTITDIRDVQVDENEAVDDSIIVSLQEQMFEAQAKTDAVALRTEADVVSRLVSAGYTEEQGQTVTGLLRGHVDPTSIADVEDWAAQCFTPPSGDELLTQALHSVLDMHGVLEMNSPASGGDPDLTYLEAGDMYNLTLLRYEGDWYCASLGDVLDAIEHRCAVPGKLALDNPSVDAEVDLDIPASSHSHTPQTP